MKKGLFFILILGIILINNVSAGIYFSQPQAAYNLGDLISVDADVNPASNDYLLKVDLICNDKSVITFNNMPIDGRVNIKFPLNSYTIGDNLGQCYFVGNYKDSEEVKSRTFDITNALTVSLSSESFFAKPGEMITVSGNVKKINGNGINGELEFTIPQLSSLKTTNDNSSNSTETSPTTESLSDNGVIYGKVVNGEFNVSFSLKEDTAAGDYRIDVLSYESYEGKRINQGSAFASLKVFQILKSGDVALNDQNFNPGKEISIRPLLMDQTGRPYYDKVTVIITDEQKNRLFEKIVNSQESVSFNIPTNTTAGNYEVDASSGSINVNKKFYINEKPLVSFKIDNGTLIVTNIGNVPYNNSIEVMLNGKPFVKKLTNLGVGEKVMYKLSGNNEVYDVKVSDGESELSERLTLTGMAIGVEELSDDQNNPSILSKAWIWIALIIVLIALIIFFGRKVIKKRSIAYPNDKKPNTLTIKSGTELPIIDNKQAIGVPRTSFSPTLAEPVLVLQGDKSKIAVIALKVKNKISTQSREELQKILKPIYQYKGAVYGQGDYIFGLFSPISTKTDKNELNAARASTLLLKLLKEHNSKFARDRIEFGIGINNGEVINKIEDRKLKFTSLANTIIGAKRISDISEEKILISKEAYEKASNEIKIEKRTINGNEAYEIIRVVESEKNEKFINDFLNRQENVKNNPGFSQNKYLSLQNNKQQINRPNNSAFSNKPYTSSQNVQRNPVSSSYKKPIAFESLNKPAPNMPNMNNVNKDMNNPDTKKETINPNFFN